MGVMLLAASGGLLGYVLAILLGRRNVGTLLNVLTGAMGAMMGAMVFSPYLGLPRVFGGDISIAAFFMSLIGAVVALGILSISIANRTARRATA